MRGRRGHRRRRSLIPLAVAAAITLSGLLGLTSANTVPSTKAAVLTQAITANTLKPTECNGITLTTVLTGLANITGSSDSELILGGPADQTIAGNNGDDCILAGGGNDSLNGGAGTDVCIGGPGTDGFNKSCETQIQ